MKKNEHTVAAKVGAIVAMNQQRIIGVDGELPWHYPEDLKRFKRETLNSTIIMGRITWLSIGEKALPKRRNIVVSSKVLDNVESYHSVEEALEQAHKNNEDVVPEDNSNPIIWVIGGGQMYQSMAHLIDFFDVTLVPDLLDESKYQRVTKLFDFDDKTWQKGAWLNSDKDSRIKHQRVVRRSLT